MLFGLEDTSDLRTLNDYLWERCRVEETVVDVTPKARGFPIPERDPKELIVYPVLYERWKSHGLVSPS